MRVFFTKVFSKISWIIRRLRGLIVSKYTSVQIGRGCQLNNVIFSSGCTVGDYVRLTGTPQITLGKDCYINCFTMIGGEVTIGNNVLISQFVNIWGRAHRFDKKDQLIWDQHGTHGQDDQGYDVKPISIGDGAWIGPHVTIFRGVKIGRGAVVGANSVVTKDIEDFAIAWGVPAAVKRFRT